jgi:hypothetical protein
MDGNVHLVPGLEPRERAQRRVAADLPDGEQERAQRQALGRARRLQDGLPEWRLAGLPVQRKQPPVGSADPCLAYRKLGN